MKTSPLASIVIPCFNQGRYLQETLDSVFNQTYDNYEVIIVDDGSTEQETLNLLQKIDNDYKQNNISIRIIHQRNQGLAMARNNGIDIANGEFVLPLDSDDFLHKNYLRETIDLALQNRQAGAVTTYIKAFGGINEIWKTKKTNLIEMLVKDFVCGNSLIRKAAFLDVKKINGFGYNPNMEGGYEDWDFWISMLEVNNWEIDCVKKPLFNYRVKEKSMYTEARKKHVELYGRILKNHKDSYYKYYQEVISGHIANYSDLNLFNEDLKSKYSDLKQDVSNPVWLIKKLFKTLLNLK